MKQRRQVRLVVIGVVLLAGAATMVGFDPPGARRTAGRLPTEALLWAEIGLTDRNHELFRAELFRRAHKAQLSTRQERWLVPRLIDHLKNDSIDGNARDACGVLATFWPMCEPALRDALNSTDSQQRHLAAALLRERVSEPDEKLLEVMLEGFRAEMSGTDWTVRYTYGWPGTVRGGFDCFSEWYDDARPFVIRGLESDDAQQRLICAGIAALQQDAELAEASATILVEHLQDNRHRRDAIFSAKALHALGADVLPLIEHAIASSDLQQRGTAEHIMYTVIPELAWELPAPAPPVLSSRRVDPLDERYDWIPMPRVDASPTE